MAVDPTVTLKSLKPGSTGRVTGFVGGEEEAMRKLLALGVTPGDVLHVLSGWPAIVFEVGSTSIALDDELAAIILVTPC
jgi:Fe2+ transport system protein FeoA